MYVNVIQNCVLPSGGVKQEHATIFDESAKCVLFLESLPVLEFTTHTMYSLSSLHSYSKANNDFLPCVLWLLVMVYSVESFYVPLHIPSSSIF